MSDRVSHERLIQVLSYNMDTGCFVWRAPPGLCVKIGAIAGTMNVYGYRRIRIDGRDYLAHVLAWFYVTGAWPTQDIDHIGSRTKDRIINRSDNRFANLREVFRSENMQNRWCAANNNKAGFLGVSWSKHRQKWQAALAVNEKDVHRSFHVTIDEAIAAYEAAKRRHHPAAF